MDSLARLGENETQTQTHSNLDIDSVSWGQRSPVVAINPHVLDLAYHAPLGHLTEVTCAAYPCNDTKRRDRLFTNMNESQLTATARYDAGKMREKAGSGKRRA